jgi:DNA modification methylase
MTIKVGRVGMVPVDSIIVAEDRARKIMGDLDELETSLKESGLISPLAVKDNKNGTYTLLAGERRFIVIKRNNVPEVPVRIYEEDLSELEMKVVEKAENFYRKEMEYYELDKLTRDIHKIQQQLYGAKSPGPGHTGWSIEDTGEMLGGASKFTISTSIKRAELREAMPELFEGCKTASDANNLIKKMDEAVIKQAIAKTIEGKKSDNQMIGTLSKCFIIRDFFEGVKEIPNSIMHLVEIDPPYGIDLTSAKKSEGESRYTLGDYNEIDKDNYQSFLAKVFTECYRVMTDHSWLICWFAPEPWFETVYQELINAGFSTTRMCGIWTKPTGQTKRPEMHLPNAYEMFFYAWKGRPAIARSRHSNIFNYSPVHPQQKIHPTERPIELMKDLYETFVFPGSRILIPFLGSGNGLISAYQLDLSAVGFELSKSYRDSFLVKVNELKG